MPPRIKELIQKIIRLRQESGSQVTLLAACPNSTAVLEAAVKCAASNKTPMLFAATLNQVDSDGGYTGWTQAEFVQQIRELARRYDWNGPLYPCLDHGGPWLKDRHTIEGLSFEQTFSAVKNSLSACLEAGYALLHIDPTVDRTMPPDQILPVDTVVERTLDLIAYAENKRLTLNLPPIDYEVGTEEVHGGLVNLESFQQFLLKLRAGLEERGLDNAWPVFIVAQVGTDLHTTYFDSSAARKLYDFVSPLGSLIKGHYSDWVENPQEYPACGMGGANVGPEFTAQEYLALQDLEAKEYALCRARTWLVPSQFMKVLEQAVIDSNRWKKWLRPEEQGKEFTKLSSERQSWLAQTGARYVWAQPQVLAARQQLYANLAPVFPDPDAYVVDRIAQAMDQFINAFHLFDTVELFEKED